MKVIQLSEGDIVGNEIKGVNVGEYEASGAIDGTAGVGCFEGGNVVGILEGVLDGRSVGKVDGIETVGIAVGLSVGDAVVGSLEGKSDVLQVIGTSL